MGSMTNGQVLAKVAEAAVPVTVAGITAAVDIANDPGRVKERSKRAERKYQKEKDKREYERQKEQEKLNLADVVDLKIEDAKNSLEEKGFEVYLIPLEGKRALKHKFDSVGVVLEMLPTPDKYGKIIDNNKLIKLYYLTEKWKDEKPMQTSSLLKSLRKKVSNRIAGETTD